MEMLQYPFMQKALLVGLLVGSLCPTIGLFLVMRRLSMVGDTLAHVSLTGVLLGVLWKLNPLPVALGLSVVVSLALEKLRKVFKYFGEISLGIIMAAGLGISVILMGITKSSDASLSGILFGSIITLQNQDIILIVILSLTTYLLLAKSYRELFFLTFDEEGARIAGVKVGLYSHLLLIMAAMVIAIGLRIVGALLVSSLMVTPVATAIILKTSFKRTLVWSNVFGLLSALLGLTCSFYLDLAPGGTIVVTSIIILLVVMCITSVRNRIITRNKESMT
ncbi:MAG: metal ABC transporter permease [Peptococcia bacterium]